MASQRPASSGPAPSAPTAAASPSGSPFAGEHFRVMFEAAPDGCLVVGEDGRIRDANDEAERMFGYRREELIGQPVEVLVPEALEATHARHREGYLRSSTKRPMGIGLELRAIRRDGSEVPVEIGLSPVETPAGRFVLAVVHDITERRRLRAFGSGVLQGAEEERQRIARDLHDDTAQSLSAILLRLQMARRTEDAGRRESLLRDMHAELLKASEGVRRILRGLRPPALEEAGIVAAIRAHVRGTAVHEKVDVSIEADDVDDLLSSDAKLALYRIIQEALTNVTRHADASLVEIRIRAEPQAVRAVVEDDGCGFSLEERGRLIGRGLGMLGMQERAAILGGSVRIESEAGRGTRVHVEIPIRG